MQGLFQQAAEDLFLPVLRIVAHAFAGGAQLSLHRLKPGMGLFALLGVAADQGTTSPSIGAYQSMRSPVSLVCGMARQSAASRCIFRRMASRSCSATPWTG
ncbi:hypothetical protein ACFSHR_15885 [Azotobacter chroococcum]